MWTRVHPKWVNSVIAMKLIFPHLPKKHFPPPHFLAVRNSRRCYLCVISLTAKANCDVRGDGSALDDNDDSFIDTEPAYVVDEFKSGHIITLLDHDNVDSQPNPVDTDTQSHQVDVDTEPRYDDIEIQPCYIDTDIHQHDGKSGHGNVDSKSRCDKIVSLVNSNRLY